MQSRESNRIWEIDKNNRYVMKRINKLYINTKQNKQRFKNKNKRQSSFFKLAKVYLNDPKLMKTNQLQTLIKLSQQNTKNKKIINILQKNYINQYCNKLKKEYLKREDVFLLRQRQIQKKQNQQQQSFVFKKHNQSGFIWDFTSIKSNLGQQMYHNFKQQTITQIKRPSNLDYIKMNHSSQNNRKNLHLDIYSNKPSKIFIKVNISPSKKVNVPTFIFNSKDTFIKRQLYHQRVLIQNKWEQVKKGYSKTVLKWSYNDSPQDYQNTMSYYFNHIKNNQQITTKDRLARLIRDSNYCNLVPDKCFPRTYILNNEYNEFLIDYERTTFLILLKKLIIFIKNKLPFKSKKIKQQIYDSLYLQHDSHQNKFEQFIYSNKFIKYPQQNQFVINIPITVQLCIFLEKIKRNCMGLEALSDKYNDILQDTYIKNRISKYSRMFDPYNLKQEYLQKKKQESNLHKIKIEFSQNFKKFVTDETYTSPSICLIKHLFQYYILFKINLPYFKSDGIENAWILKQNQGSRGKGIFLTNKLQKINDQKSNTKIIQKYIQKPWILNQQKLEKYNTEGDLDWIKNSNLYGKKFDIRQWVLITSVNPLKVYMFQKAYLRICSQNYQQSNFQDFSCHLTNYSLNKNKFQSEQQSIYSIDDLEKILLNLQGVSYEQEIKPIIQIMVKNIIYTASEYLEHSYRCFQLLGFDIILDYTLNPWLLQINQSPSCSQRALWLENMLQDMTYGLFKLVLPQQYKGNLKQKQQQFRWLKIIQEEQMKEKLVTDLQVKGKGYFGLNTKANRKKEI